MRAIARSKEPGVPFYIRKSHRTNKENSSVDELLE